MNDYILPLKDVGMKDIDSVGGKNASLGEMIKNSILLCTRNEEKYVENTIRNLNKFIPHVEIIIVDDQSNDKTIDVIKKLKSNFDIKLIERNKKSGLASAFLRALIESSGSNVGWIVFPFFSRFHLTSVRVRVVDLVYFWEISYVVFPFLF